MKDNLHSIRLIALVGASVIASLTLNAEAANVIAQELKKGSAEPEYFEVTKDHAAMHRAVICTARSFRREKQSVSLFSH